MIAIVALYISLVNNQHFWFSLLEVLQKGGDVHSLFLVSVFALIFSVVFLILSLFSVRPVFKPALVIMLIATAFTGYFMDTFGTIIDESMIQNVVETDVAEAGEILNASLLVHVLLYGVIPSLVILSLGLKQQSRKLELLSRSMVLLAIITVTSSVVYEAYRDVSFIFRENKQITYMINPIYPMRSLVNYYRHQQPAEKTPLQMVFNDVKRKRVLDTVVRKSLFVIVLGETARADNFHINGYPRNTTPGLEQRQVINFSQVSSCGTATAISVPCIFSILGHSDYDDAIARNSENLLDALNHAGVKVLWRDNNSGCKGVCNRVSTENMHHLDIADLCNENGCYDEVLLYRLQEYIDNLEQDAVIVLHQQGSHGPSYFKRYPGAFSRFSPACNQDSVQNCSYDEIVNAYDNTILYTDYFLSKVIDLLKENSVTHDTAMLYVSDHGESLGENGVYLHGLPYVIAPRQQTHVPFILWLSDTFTQDLAIDRKCLVQHQDMPLSHDNVLHSVLGVMGVETQRYSAEKDIFNNCQMQHQHAAHSLKDNADTPETTI